MKIILENHFAYVQGTAEEQAFASRCLRVKDPNAFWKPSFQRKKWDGFIRFMDWKTKRFPTGLLNYLTEQCRYVHRNVEVTDLRNKPTNPVLPLNLRGVNAVDYPYDYQAKIIDDCILNGRGIVAAAMNSGKSIIEAALAQRLGVNTLVLTNNLVLLDQLHKLFEDLLGVKIGKIGAGHNEILPITIGTVQTLVARIKDEVDEILEYLNSVRCLLIEECHHTQSASYITVANNCASAFYRFGFSGTPLRGEVISDLKLIGVTGNVIGSISNQELIDRNISAKPTITFLDMRSKSVPNAMSWSDVYRYGLVENDIRNNMIVDLAINRLRKDKQVFIIVAIIEHGQILLNKFKAQGIKTEFIWGETEADTRRKILDSFKKGTKLKLLISSTIADEGLNIPQLDCLIMAAGQKDKVRVLQRVGRALRKKEGKENVCEIVDFFDFNHRYLLQHSRERVKIYSEEGFTIKRWPEPGKPS